MSAATKGRVDLDQTRQSLEQLGLMHASEQLSELVGQAVKKNLSVHRFLDELLWSELAHREERRIKTSLRLSGLPPGQTLGNFDFNFQPAIRKSRIETLATCEWIREPRRFCSRVRRAWERRIWRWPWEPKPSKTVSRCPSFDWMICFTP